MKQSWAPRNSVFLRPPGEAPDETRRWTITCTWLLSALPTPTVAFFTTAGVYSAGLLPKSNSKSNFLQIELRNCEYIANILS